MQNPTDSKPQSQENIYLSDYSERDKKWDAKRSQTLDTERVYSKAPEQKYTRLEERLKACTGVLGYTWQTDKTTGKSRIKLSTAQFCKVRHCPVCSWRRSLKNSAKFHAALPEIQASYPTHRFLFLTLTVPNCKYEDLRSTIKAMNAAWQRLIERKNWPATGWIRTTEVTDEKARTGFAHPHFHVLLMVPPSYFAKNYVKHEEWLKRWQQAMRDPSITQLNIKVVKAKDGSSDLSDAVRETLKYSVKPQDGLENPEFLYCVTEQLHKMRFFASGGALKNILKEDLSDKEMIEGEDGEANDNEAPQLFFKYGRTERRYKKI